MFQVLITLNSFKISTRKIPIFIRSNVVPNVIFNFVIFIRTNIKYWNIDKLKGIYYAFKLAI